MEVADILRFCRIVPILNITDIQQTIPLASAFIAAGLNVFEVSLQSPLALDAIAAIRRQFPKTILGAGMIQNAQQIQAAKIAGAHFATGLGMTAGIFKMAQEHHLPFLPGVMTPCEILAAQEMGFKVMKFFPAEVAGGMDALKTYAKVFSDVYFFPTGGIDRKNFQDYLSLSNVLAVSGSWLTPSNFMTAANWEAIASSAKEVVRVIN